MTVFAYALSKLEIRPSRCQEKYGLFFRNL